MNTTAKVTIGALSGILAGFGIGKVVFTKSDDGKKYDAMKKRAEDAESAFKANDLSEYVSKKIHEARIEELHVSYAKSEKEAVTKATQDMIAIMSKAFEDQVSKLKADLAVAVKAAKPVLTEQIRSSVEQLQACVQHLTALSGECSLEEFKTHLGFIQGYVTLSSEALNEWLKGKA